MTSHNDAISAVIRYIKVIHPDPIDPGRRASNEELIEYQNRLVVVYRQQAALARKKADSCTGVLAAALIEWASAMDTCASTQEDRLNSKDFKDWLDGRQEWLSEQTITAAAGSGATDEIPDLNQIVQPYLDEHEKKTKIRYLKNNLMVSAVLVLIATGFGSLNGSRDAAAGFLISLTICLACVLIDYMVRYTGDGVAPDELIAKLGEVNFTNSEAVAIFKKHLTRDNSVTLKLVSELINAEQAERDIKKRLQQPGVIKFLASNQSRN